MDIKDFQTLTGLTLDEVAARLDAELPGNAYTSVPGGADLTDIDPGYMRKTSTRSLAYAGLAGAISLPRRTCIPRSRTARVRAAATGACMWPPCYA